MGVIGFCNRTDRMPRLYKFQNFRFVTICHIPFLNLPPRRPDFTPAIFFTAKASSVRWDMRFRSVSADGTKSNAMVFELILSLKSKSSLIVCIEIPFDIFLMIRPRLRFSTATVPEVDFIFLTFIRLR